MLISETINTESIASSELCTSNLISAAVCVCVCRSFFLLKTMIYHSTLFGKSSIELVAINQFRLNGTKFCGECEQI